MNRIKVHLDKKTSSSYEIYIGKDIIDRMGLIFTKHNWAGRYIILTDSTVSALHGTKVQRALRETGLQGRYDRLPGRGGLKGYSDLPAHLRSNDGYGS